jgi:hypothetical protein
VTAARARLVEPGARLAAGGAPPLRLHSPEPLLLADFRDGAQVARGLDVVRVARILAEGDVVGAGVLAASIAELDALAPGAGLERATG